MISDKWTALGFRVEWHGMTGLETARPRCSLPEAWLPGRGLGSLSPSLTLSSGRLVQGAEQAGLFDPRPPSDP